MKILSVGQFTKDGISNTCLHRNWALHKLGDVTDIDSTFEWNFLCRIMHHIYVELKLPISYYRKGINRKIVDICRQEKFDIVWIDKGNYILPSTLRTIHRLQPDAKIIGYSPDNMAERHNQTVWFTKGLKYYDWYLTTKSYIVDWLKEYGCQNVMFVNNAYEDTFHHPYNLTNKEKETLGGIVGFIGSWEKERCEAILHLADNGIPVRVWGGGKWLEYMDYGPNLRIEGKALFSDDYNRALSAFDISLCFLRKINFDLQTTRTMEIPACGSLLMAERTVEHESLFIDGEEAVFFSSNEELLEKCRFYISHPEERKRIADNGLKRCHESGYSNYMTIKKALGQIIGHEQ